jgi:SAM-dependent methyltransferase
MDDDDAFYAALEGQFRADLDQLTAHFLQLWPRLHAAGVGSKERPVLDLGCGRGEWLEFLGQRGLVGRGCDASPAAVETCRTRGCKAEVADLVSWIESAEPGSAGAVTMFHVAEHLPMPVLRRVVRAARRALCPGGLLLCETPNPENIQVGALNFYLDPTHLRPIPPQLFRFILEFYGFSDVAVVGLSPWTELRRQKWKWRILRHWVGRALPKLEGLLYSDQDYAVVGVAP